MKQGPPEDAYTENGYYTSIEMTFSGTIIFHEKPFWVATDPAIPDLPQEELDPDSDDEPKALRKMVNF